jgi:hypothetical protein
VPKGPSCNDPVEGVRIERELKRIGLGEVPTAVYLCALDLVFFQHWVVKVDANDVSVGRLEQERDPAGPGPDIQQELLIGEGGVFQGMGEVPIGILGRDQPVVSGCLLGIDLLEGVGHTEIIAG